MAKGIVIRNEQEQLAFDTIIKAHEVLCKKLNVSTDVTFQRECNWGRNARHAGWYRSSEKLVALNFRNIFGASIVIKVIPLNNVPCFLYHFTSDNFTIHVGSIFANI